MLIIFLSIFIPRPIHGLLTQSWAELVSHVCITRRDASLWPAGECLCHTITIKWLWSERIKTSEERSASHKQALSRPRCQINNIASDEDRFLSLEMDFDWYWRKTDLNWTLLRWKMLILCIFPPNIESWRLGSPETYNLASTDFLNTWEQRGKRLRRYQWIKNGLLQNCRQGFNDNVVLVQSPIKSAQWYPSDQKWFESISQCRKWIGKIVLE